MDSKPASYTPSSHRHNWNELDGKPSSYTPSSHRHNWNELDGKPSSYTPASHHHDSLYLKRAEFRIMAPAGVVMAFAMQNLPSGWLECDGSPLSRTAYADLYAAIGTTYGYTSASDFRLPDLRGEFVRGWDHGRGVDPSRNLGSFEGYDWKGFSMTTTGVNTRSYSHGPVYMGKSTTQYIGNFFTGGWSAPAAAVGTKWDDSEARPRNLALMYCIKY